LNNEALDSAGEPRHRAKLTQLRPVTFHLKTDPAGALQSGLIAEEVAQVYPELVIRDQNGRIDGVRYDELAPMLLNEVSRSKGLLLKTPKSMVLRSSLRRFRSRY
jgi:hypothetical protein